MPRTIRTVAAALVALLIATPVAAAPQYAVAGHPEPPPAPPPATAPVAEPTDGINALPFVLGVVGALIVGLAAGRALHLLLVRRRQATGLPA
jgi:hypothetical protein